MGAWASQELDRWTSVSDLALVSRRMRIIPTLPVECQVEALRYLWRSLRWLPAGEDLLAPDLACDSLLVIVRGEAQAVLGSSGYMPLLPEGSFFCEASLLGRASRRSGGDQGKCSRRPFPHLQAWPLLWPLRGAWQLPGHVLWLVDEFLAPGCDAPRFHGRVRTTRRTLVAALSRGQFLASLRKAAEPSTIPAFDRLRVGCNALQNVTSMGASARELAAQDIAALRVVCEGPMNMSCATVGPAWRCVPASFCGISTEAGPDGAEAEAGL